MRIYPPTLDIGDKDGFTPDNDLFDRAELGRGMTNLISTVSDPLVIAFDGQWGSGKTTFLKMWSGELRKSGFPVVYFDAFENDYVSDAFAALVREIVALEELKLPAGKRALTGFREESVKLGSQLLRGAVSVGAKASVRALTAGLVSAEDLKEITDDIVGEAGSVADAYMEELLDNPMQQKKIVDSFRKKLEKLPGLIATKRDSEPQKPLIYIIDELDRCKPIFALQILERIKHFLSVPNVHIILGVHLNQLEGFVRYAYGTDIDASAYLQKFINLKIVNIDTARNKNERQTIKYVKHLQMQLQLPQTRTTQLTVEFIERISLKYDFSFRSIERIFSNVAIALAFLDERQFAVGPLIGGLCILKVAKPDLFLNAKQGRLSYNEIEKYFGFSKELPEEPSHKSDWQRDWWEYCLSDEVPERLTNFNQGGEAYEFRDRKDIVIFMADKIVDRLTPIN